MDSLVLRDIHGLSRSLLDTSWWFEGGELTIVLVDSCNAFHQFLYWPGYDIRNQYQAKIFLKKVSYPIYTRVDIIIIDNHYPKSISS